MRIQFFCNLLRLFISWNIVCTNINYKVIWVLPKRRCDVVLHTFKRPIGKYLHMCLAVFQRIWEVISSNMFDNTLAHDYYFLRLLWNVIFPRGSVGSIVTKLYQRLLLFSLILSWCRWTITTLIFLTNFISQIAINVCTYNIITIFVFINCSFTSFKIFIAVFS